MAILQDLGGPKIRTGRLEGGRPLQVTPGESLHHRHRRRHWRSGPRVHDLRRTGAAAFTPGDRLLLADGLIELRVDATDGREIQTTVIDGGEIGEHKGINAPGVPLPASAVTPKDVEDLKFGLALGVDMVALSFVQTAADVRQARQLMLDANAGDVPLIAKLERPQAIRAPRRNPRCLRRRDGGARRSRARTAARAGTARAEGNHARAPDSAASR